MSGILVKLFATALTMSQVAIQPDNVRTSFDPVQDRGEVERILKDGCAHMRRAFDIEEINLDELITTAMDDPDALTGNLKVLQGLSFSDLHASYRQFCTTEQVDRSPVDLGEVITYFNEAVADLPDAGKLKGLKLPGVTVILDQAGKRFAEVYEPDHRRMWVPLSEIPKSVQQAFVAAEDKRFYEHKGIDERGVIRAFMSNLTNPGRPAGGSTVTQQVVKNLLVGDDVTYERKMREMIVAARVERILSKDEILELYLNAIYFGRSSWGIEMAARSYFGKPAKELSLAEGALLAGLVKGPNVYNPDRSPDRALDRVAYVLSRMEEDKFVTAGELKPLLGKLPPTIVFERPQRSSGFHFVDFLDRSARPVAGIESLTSSGYTVRSTINPALQKATEAALQEGLARYELNTGRSRFQGAESNLAETVAKLSGDDTPSNSDKASPPWRRALEATRLPLYDVQWPAAIVIENSAARKGALTLRIGLADGRTMPLTVASADARRALKLYDVVRVRMIPASGKKAARAELRMPPSVQGAAVVLENRTGRILAMAGGFSYPLSQLNRVTQAHRQPGSALKPLTYLAALAKGLQPNTLVWDEPVTFPPIGGNAGARASDSWTPKNYDGRSGGIMTLRRALETSQNLVTARLLEGGLDWDPERSLRRVCELALEAQLYVECEPYYPFVLGAQPVRLLDLAAFYAAIATEGALPSPHALEAVEERGRTIYRRENITPVQIGSADRVAFYQLKTILQGVLERGTARSIRALAPYVAGKTGTSDHENDAWFAGFTNDVTVAVWVGYDNADGKRRTLGRGQTGGKIAVPIFQAIIEAAWAHHAPKAPLNPPSPQAARQLIAMPIDLETGDRITDGRGKAFTEHFRLSQFGQFNDTQFRLVPEYDAYASRHRDPWSDGDEAPLGGYFDDAPVAEAPGWFESMPPTARGRAHDLPWWEEDQPRRSRRIDPDYFWGNGRIY
jgi:membrane carboxypeptidase/penicillin-binding protein